MSTITARLTPQTLRTLALGALSLALYILLFSFEAEVLAASTGGGWAFVVPIVIAFVFSFVHGAFTSGFWDMLGLKAKTRKEPKRWSK
ncbi:hypothetical protein MTBLM5_10065 [Magnetospirillum sp. LM-5]|uniref:hypothetical protein n=1 Tax=Magnetospirillum sp. LM-5 TaxID=2681466 RepID=UPI0013804C15|nr:hypothetical protein [Magnetospirillum sp. LM-5]CAA7611455.1 hypothetical protein MTBLM5_10065 [Magnetospirillum sp. LM-5]